MSETDSCPQWRVSDNWLLLMNAWRAEYVERELWCLNYWMEICSAPPLHLRIIAIRQRAEKGWEDQIASTLTLLKARGEWRFQNEWVKALNVRTLHMTVLYKHLPHRSPSMFSKTPQLVIGVCLILSKTEKFIFLSYSIQHFHLVSHLSCTSKLAI